MAQNLSSLKAESGKNGKPSDLEILDKGETVWYKGSPMPSERGTISLRTSNNLILVLREKDVLDVNKDGVYFEVNVKVRTPIIVRTENMIEAGSSECGCGDKENQDKPSTIAMEQGCLEIRQRCVLVRVGNTFKLLCSLVPISGPCRPDPRGPIGPPEGGPPW